MFKSKDIGIDLGTANTLICAKGRGIILREPSVVAINKNTGDVKAVGEEAKDMLGRTPGSIVAIRPLKDGVIADFDITQIMLKNLIKKAINHSWWRRPRVVICVPSGVTEVERRAIEEAVLGAGAKEAYLIEEPMAAAIGAGLKVEEPVGKMVVDIGGGTSEVAVLSLGGIVTSKSLRVAGDEFDDYIVSHIKKQYNLMVGDQTAEMIKKNIGSAFQYEDESVMLIKGRDLLTGLPKEVLITAAEIREALNEPVMLIVDAIKSTLEKTPPELSADIIETGICLAGGGSLLRSLDQLVEKETGIHTFVAPAPLDCVVNGTGVVIEDLASYKRVLATKKRY